MNLDSNGVGVVRPEEVDVKDTRLLHRLLFDDRAMVNDSNDRMSGVECDRSCIGRQFCTICRSPSRP